MKRAFIVLTPILLAAIALLGLNLRESDHYEFGSEAAPARGRNVDGDDGAFARIFPEPRFVHACAGCGECVHPFEIVDNRRLMSIHDHDGWYKLFWAADEDYSYSDPIHLLADFGNNRTAETPRGTWTIRLRSGPATHRSAPAHDCGQIPRDITLHYELVLSEDPLEATPHSGDGPLKIPGQFCWLVSNPGKQVCLGWRLVGSPAVDVDPCPCAKP